jgi:hypothetical protein
VVGASQAEEAAAAAAAAAAAQRAEQAAQSAPRDAAGVLTPPGGGGGGGGVGMTTAEPPAPEGGADDATMGLPPAGGGAHGSGRVSPSTAQLRVVLAQSQALVQQSPIISPSAAVSLSFACVGSPCLRHCVHGASIAGDLEQARLGPGHGADTREGCRGGAGGHTGLVVWHPESIPHTAEIRPQRTRG